MESLGNELVQGYLSLRKHGETQLSCGQMTFTLIDVSDLRRKINFYLVTIIHQTFFMQTFLHFYVVYGVRFHDQTFNIA